MSRLLPSPVVRKAGPARAATANGVVSRLLSTRVVLRAGVLRAAQLGIASALVLGCAGGEAMESDTEAASVGAMDESGPGNVTETTGVTGLTATTGVPTTGVSETDTPDDGSTTGPVSGSSGDDTDASTGQAEETGERETDEGSTSGEGSTSTTDDSASDTAGGFVDLSGFVVRQTNTARSFTFPDNTIVSVGDIVVVGRDATQGAFEGYWSVDLGDALYFDTSDTFPAINGDETFLLDDPEGSVVDGPSLTIQPGDRVQRTDSAENGAGGWETASDATATPGTDMTAGDITFISEVSDATGVNGSFAYEFVEIHVGG